MNTESKEKEESTGLIIGEAINHTGLKKKLIRKVDFKGKQYLQFKEEWRASTEKEWNVRTKKVVSFSKEEWDNFVYSLKSKGIETFKDLSMIFSEMDKRG